MEGACFCKSGASARLGNLVLLFPSLFVSHRRRPPPALCRSQLDACAVRPGDSVFLHFATAPGLGDDSVWREERVHIGPGATLFAPIAAGLYQGLLHVKHVEGAESWLALPGGGDRVDNGIGGFNTLFQSGPLRLEFLAGHADPHFEPHAEGPREGAAGSALTPGPISL